MIEQSKLEQNFQNKLRIEDLKIEGGQLSRISLYFETLRTHTTQKICLVVV
jgi:hypothetical protein